MKIFKDPEFPEDIIFCENTGDSVLITADASTEDRFENEVGLPPEDAITFANELTKIANEIMGNEKTDHIAMSSNEIKRNLIHAYKRHCRLKIDSKSYEAVMRNLEQRDVVWSDVCFAAGISVDLMQDIYDEEVQNYGELRSGVIEMTDKELALADIKKAQQLVSDVVEPVNLLLQKAKKTVDQLSLDMSPEELREHFEYASIVMGRALELMDGE